MRTHHGSSWRSHSRWRGHSHRLRTRIHVHTAGSSIAHLSPSRVTSAASESAMAQPTPNPSTASSSATASPVVPRRRRRKEHPPIDIDKTIADAREAVKAAQRAMTEARALARNERRKRARLIKKAAQLSPRDLDRIAILKKCGVWDPVSQSRTAGAPAEHAPPAGADSRSLAGPSP